MNLAKKALSTARIAPLLAAISLPLAAQQPSSTVDMQRQAMQKLNFLAGKWSGPVSISHGPGEPMHFTQTEDVQYKLDGLVMLVEGTSRNTEGKPVFSALATISFDDNTHQYRIRAYNGGHFVDAALTVVVDGFSWSFDSGPVRVTNTMHLTAKGEWAETSDVAFGSNPSMRSVDMLLTHAD